MIDVHAHILPGLDDGPTGIEEAAAILRDSSAKGIRKIIATPHFSEGNTYDLQDIQTKIKTLNKISQKEGLGVSVLPGAEYFITDKLAKKAANGDIITLANSSYILVELPFDKIPENAFNVFFDLVLLGYNPIIAHPERCQAIIDKPVILFDLIQKGTYAQLNAGSILGKYGSKIQKTAETLIKARLYHVMGSDLHSSRKRRQIQTEAMAYLKTIDREITDIFVNNAEKILDNKYLTKLEAISPEKKLNVWQKLINFVS